LKINGVTNTVNITRTAPLHTESNYITAAFQLDEDGSTPPTPYNAEVKEWTVEGFRGNSLAYEVVCPTVATLTSAENYSLTTYIRRAVSGTTSMLHPVGSNFGELDSATFKIDLPTQWIGTTLWFKFPAYNKIGGQQNSLDECVAYPFTPQGIVGSFDVSVDNIGISHDFIATIDSAGPYVITGA
jgi:hypothetical protein